VAADGRRNFFLHRTLNVLPSGPDCKKKGETMETIMQCRACGEDTNRADWEAAQECCAHCGEATEGIVWRGLGRLSSLRQRLELELVWRPVARHA